MNAARTRVFLGRAITAGRRGPAALTLVAVSIGCAMAELLVAAETTAELKQSTDDRVEARADPGAFVAGVRDSADELSVRYALTRLRLAELDVERAAEANLAVPGSIGGRELERLRNHVEVMRRQVDIASGVGVRGIDALIQVRDEMHRRGLCDVQVVGLVSLPFGGEAGAAHRRLLDEAIEMGIDVVGGSPDIDPEPMSATIAAVEAIRENARADLAAAVEANQRTPGTISRVNVDRLRAKAELADIRLALCRSPGFELSLLAEMQWSIEQLTDEVIDLRHQIDSKAASDAGR